MRFDLSYKRHSEWPTELYLLQLLRDLLTLSVRQSVQPDAHRLAAAVAAEEFKLESSLSIHGAYGLIAPELVRSGQDNSVCATESGCRNLRNPLPEPTPAPLSSAPPPAPPGTHALPAISSRGMPRRQRGDVRACRRMHRVGGGDGGRWRGWIG